MPQETNILKLSLCEQV